MEYFLQQLLNILALGGTYALLAIGLAIVFSVLGFINFAHGELMTITGYAIFFSLAAGAPFLLALVLGVAAAAAAAAAIEYVAFRPVRNSNPVTMLLTSLAVGSILHVLFQNLIAVRPKAIPVPSALAGAIEIGSVTIGTIQLLSVVTTLVALAALALFLKHSLLGLSMRAAAQDFNVTRLMGVNANLVISTAFCISGVLAGIAGILWVFQRGSVDPLMGFQPVLKAFIAVALGGTGSLSGAVAGGVLLGAIEVLLRAYLPEGMQPYKEALSLSMVIAVLFFWPQGLIPRKEAIR